MSSKERISWIDSAKGILMLCVIAGHTLTLWNLPERLIYSFHIPLFVILSGFTMGDVLSTKEFFIKLKKSFFQLIIPMLCIYALEAIGFMIKDSLSFVETIKLFCNTSLYAIHVPWFLCVLFYARLFYNLLLLLKKEKLLIFLAIFISAYFIPKIPGFNGFYQQLEKVPFFMFFLFVGRAIKKYNLIDALKKHGQILIFIFMPLWLILLDKAYFDLGLFYLGDLKYAIPCAALACSTMIYFFITLDPYLNRLRQFNIFSLIGQHTILLLAIHDLDFIFMPWHKSFSTRLDEYGTLILKILFILAVMGIILAGRKIIMERKSDDI